MLCPAGTVSITVASQTTVTDNLAYNFLVLVRPAVIDKVTPLTGPLVGGTVVTITGSGFSSLADVSFVGYDSGSGEVVGPPVDCVWRNSGGERKWRDTPYDVSWWDGGELLLCVRIKSLADSRPRSGFSCCGRIHRPAQTLPHLATTR